MKSTLNPMPTTAKSGEAPLERNNPPGLASGFDRSHVQLLASLLGESEDVVLAALLSSHDRLARMPVVAKRRN